MTSGRVEEQSQNILFQRKRKGRPLDRRILRGDPYAATKRSIQTRVAIGYRIGRFLTIAEIPAGPTALASTVGPMGR